MGHELGFGLEVGAKPELIAALGLTTTTPTLPIVCNGFKDREYLGARRVGLDARSAHHTRGRAVRGIGDPPRVGGEARNLPFHRRAGAPFGPGVGKVAGVGGSPREVRPLPVRPGQGGTRPGRTGRLDSLHLLHSHVGSQIRDIAAVKAVVSEIGHLYVELRRLGAPLDVLDVGGGMGVDYDGTRTATETSVDYALAEYASDLVYRIRDICDESGEPHPDIATESGRAGGGLQLGPRLERPRLSGACSANPVPRSRPLPGGPK